MAMYRNYWAGFAWISTTNAMFVCLPPRRWLQVNTPDALIPAHAVRVSTR